MTMKLPHPALASLFSTCMLACTLDPKNVGDEPGESSGTLGATGDGPSSASMTSTSATVGEASGSGHATAEGTTGSGDGTGPKLDIGTADDDGPKFDLAPMECEFEPIVRDFADASKTPPVDCGFVMLDDPIEAWQTAHVCAVEALAADGAFALLWQRDSIDSTAYGAVAGLVGEVYGIAEFSYDTKADPVLWQRRCSAVVTLDDCGVGAGEMCLTCIAAGDPVTICEFPP